MNKLEQIDAEVFDRENPRVEHLICKDIPDGLTEEMYIKIYRKQMSVFRYHIYQCVKSNTRNPNP